MTYNPRILDDILRVRSLTQKQLSKRIGVELDEELQREPEPAQGVLNKIAKELAVPAFIFYMKAVPPLHDAIPDFRSEHPAPTAKSRETIEVIQSAENIQKAAADLKGPKVTNLPYFTSDQRKQISEVALKAREFFGISLKDQKDAKDAREFYVICRKKIEDKGIFVIHDSFPEGDGSGFCLSHPTHPVIVINTKKQTRGRRLFTLVHELAHVLLRESGISDPFVRHNSTERLCNRFAGNFLVPGDYVEDLLGTYIVNDPSLDDVRAASRKLKISQQATVLRLEQLGLFKDGSHTKWLQAIHNLGNPDFSEKSGGSGVPPPQEKVKLSKYGFRFAKVFDDLLQNGSLSEIQLYRLSGLKPKYLPAYFSYAKSINLDNITGLAIEDE